VNAVHNLSQKNGLRRKPSIAISLSPWYPQRLHPKTGAIGPSEVLEAVISLHLVDSGQILHLAGRSEFTLGRAADGQPILPDVDLSPYEAYTQGYPGFMQL